MSEETRQKEMEKLQDFLKEFKANYCVEDDTVIINAEITELIYYNPIRSNRASLDMKIKINSLYELKLISSKDSLYLDMWKGYGSTIILVNSIDRIEIRKDKIYIRF